MVSASQDAYHIVDPVFTPYYQNGSVNYEVIPAYLELCVNSGVDIVLLGGSTAEWPSLTSDERLSLLLAWRKAVDALPSNTTKPKILFHAGDTSIAKAQYLASESEKNGADWILLVAPCIMRPATLDDLIKTMGTIASKAPNLPMIYYHYPALYGVDFDMAGTISFLFFFFSFFSLCNRVFVLVCLFKYQVSHLACLSVLSFLLPSPCFLLPSSLW
jgi:dihydrodipicolinate synthase/N-acetylneuraminate lyase